MTVLTLRQQQDVFVSDAKRQLMEILTPYRRNECFCLCLPYTEQTLRPHIHLGNEVKEPYDPSKHTPGPLLIYCITRHRTRTEKTAIVDFLVIRDNQPVYLSARISTALGRYHLPPAPWSGMVLTEEKPQDVIRQLSQLLYQRDCLEVKEL